MSLTNDTGNTAGHTSDGAVTVTPAGEGSYGTRYMLNDSGTWVDDASSLTITAEGSHSVKVQQVDQAGNWSDSTTLNFTLDTTPVSSVTVSRKTGDTGVDTDGTVHFKLHTSEPLDPSSVTADDFTLTKFGVTSSDLSISPASGDAVDTFIIAVPYTGEGVINLLNHITSEFSDRAGNVQTGEYIWGSDASVTVDNVGPTATISVGESVVDAGDTVTVAVSFDEALGGSPTAADVIGALTTPGLALSGTPTADGNTYTATFVATAATNSTGNQVSIAAGAFNDANGNGTSAATSSSYDVDSVSPVITGFDAAGADGTYGGTYGPGDTIFINATASEGLVAGSAIRATLSNGEVVTLTADTGGTVLSGSFVVQTDDTGSADLDVSSFALGDGVTPGTVPADQSGNVMTSTTLPADRIADTQDIVIDTTGVDRYHRTRREQ